MEFSTLILFNNGMKGRFIHKNDMNFVISSLVRAISFSFICRVLVDKHFGGLLV